eukprot:350288-Chlamydomonas_euryale.AAC.4
MLEAQGVPILVAVHSSSQFEYLPEHNGYRKVLAALAHRRLGRYSMYAPGLRGVGIATSALRKAVASCTTACHSAAAAEPNLSAKADARA